MRRRVARALALGRALGVAEFMPIGGLGRFAPAEAEVMARLLADAGITRSLIHSVPEGDNTIRSLLASWPLLSAWRASSGGVVHVCTDDYHALRCQTILRIWGMPTERIKAGDLSAEGLSPPLAKQRVWMSLRDRVALLKDVTLALLWRARL